MDRGEAKHGVAPASLQAAMGALNMLTDHSPEAKKRDSIAPTITTTSYKDDMYAAKSPRKDAIPIFKKKKSVDNPIGRRTTYCFLPPKIENQLLESRCVTLFLYIVPNTVKIDCFCCLIYYSQ